MIGNKRSCFRDVSRIVKGPKMFSCPTFYCGHDFIEPIVRWERRKHCDSLKSSHSGFLPRATLRIRLQETVPHRVQSSIIVGVAITFLHPRGQRQGTLWQHLGDAIGYHYTLKGVFKTGYVSGRRGCPRVGQEITSSP